MIVSMQKFKVTLLALFTYILFLWLIDSTISDYKAGVFIMSILGWVMWIYIALSWKRISGQLFSLYFIFVSFAILFMYGQCLMWAFGIHTNSEIVNRVIEGGVRLTEEDIFRTQLVTLTGLLLFHLGAVWQYKVPSVNSRLTSENRASGSLLSICELALAFSALCTYVYWIQNVLIYRVGGYGSYQYGASSGNMSSIIVIGSWLFIPSIIGVLISSHYRKIFKQVCYGLFAIYVILCTMAGDRGWIYEVVILVWLHYRMQDQIDIKRLIKLAAVGFVVVLFAASISKVRQSGISVNSIINSIKNDNPLSSAFFEMGGTMAPAAIILKDHSFSYPYGNTYLLAIPEMITTRFITMFVPNYQGIGGWFSQSYLGITYGAGFSMIAEAVANYGRYFAPVWMLILGGMVGRVISIHPEEKNEITLFFKSTTCLALLFLVRNSTVNALKRWFFTTIIILFVVTVLSNRYRGKVDNHE